VVVKRSYDASRRQAQARQTRRAILNAAGQLFVERGYAATTLAAIAAQAGVAVQTVYAVFGNKRQLLSDYVDVSVAGDDEPVPLSERSFVDDIRQLADPRDKLRRYARHLSEVNARTADVMLALAGAATADADAAAILRKNHAERRAGMLGFAGVLLSTGQVRADHDLDAVADVLWLAMDVRNYDWLVRQRGWPVERYEQWYVDTVSAAVLTPARPRRRTKNS
jgi:AcrR family transcriptional regulator